MNRTRNLLEYAGALVLDIQTFHAPLPHDILPPMPDGTFLIFGYCKKALQQSLPGLAGCLVPAPPGCCAGPAGPDTGCWC